MSLKEQLRDLRETGMTWQKISKCFNICERTLYGRVQEFDIPREFSDVPDSELDNLLQDIMVRTPRVGESYIRGSLKSRGMQIQRWRVRQRLQILDPVGRSTRRSRAIQWRV